MGDLIWIYTSKRQNRDGVMQLFTRLNRYRWMFVRRELEPHQNSVTLSAQYWLFPATGLYKNNYFVHIRRKINKNKIGTKQTRLIFPIFS